MHRYATLPLLNSLPPPPGVATDPGRELHITSFLPRASKDTVHHLMVVGCPSPVTSSRNLWNCGGSLGEDGLDYPGSTCPGSATSQVH